MPDNRTRIPRTCEQCGKTFAARLSNVARGWGKFCSRECSTQSQRGSGSTQWNGGRYVSPEGYVMLNLTDRRNVAEHRYVMEQFLGRALSPDEHVHHINGVKTDNRIENLQIVSPSEHMRLHAPGQHRVRRWAFKHDRCIECGTTDQRHQGHGMCGSCYWKWYYTKGGS
jgi:hypothetical protein